MTRGVRRRKDKRPATAILRDLRAVLVGELVGIELQVANTCERWYQWTCMLAIALTLQLRAKPPR